MDIILDNRLFVIGLTEMFRQEMKAVEIATLLPMAESSCRALGLSPAAFRIEGYYGEQQALSRYFGLIRALQAAEIRSLPPGRAGQDLKRLREIFSSPAMGRAEENGRLLPRPSSPFGEALRTSQSWSIHDLEKRAKALVRNDDAGLLTVASVTGDAVALCVARETVALSAEVELAELETPDFIWSVSPEVTERAERFVLSLKQTLDIQLPNPGPAAADLYGAAARAADLVGRCILVGERPGEPYPLYHWYIGQANGELVTNDFWSTAMWTTSDLRAVPVERRPAPGACLSLDQKQAPERAVPSSEWRGTKWLARLFGRRG